MQCLSKCGVNTFSADPYSLNIDHQTMSAIPPLPKCPRCGAMARPNILMFGDWGWDSSHAETQQQQLRSWLASLAGAPLVVVECARAPRFPPCGSPARTSLAATSATLIRINPREPEVPEDQISLTMGAYDALRAR